MLSKMWINNIFLWLSLYFAKAQFQILDSRCYLAEGGSAENFLASENATVGSIIGTLSINGDPKKDITLSLREKDSPVTIGPNSKHIILSKPLDKEGIDGPASVYVNVICDRRLSNDPSFLIPVNIRVTDVNDNSPMWIGAPFTINISEVTIVGTRILQGIRAIDNDQLGIYSTIEYHVLPGPHSKFVAFISPLEGTVVLKQELDYEMIQNFTVALRAQDQGVPPRYSDTTLTVFVQDADDQNPKFYQEVYRGTFQGGLLNSKVMIYPEPINAIDQDSGINSSILYSIVPSAQSSHFSVDSRTAELRVIKLLNNTNSVTLVIKATQSDNVDRYALSTVLLSQLHPVQEEISEFTRSNYKVKLKENYPPGSVILSLVSKTISNNIKFRILNDSEQQWFTVDRNGDIRLKRWLDYETHSMHKFTVELSDGSSKQFVEVQVEVIDVNDWEPRFRKPHYLFKVSTASVSAPVVLGRVEAADGDVKDRITYSIQGDQSALFYVDARGDIWLNRNVTDESTFKLQLTATDSGFPAKSTTVPLMIEFEQANSLNLKWTNTTISVLAVGAILLIVTVLGIISYFYRSSSKDTSSVPIVIERTKAYNKNNNISLMTANSRGSNSSISASASTIIAASLERDHDSYTATIRDIVNRTQQADRCMVRSSDIEQDSLTNSESGFQCQQPDYSGSNWRQKQYTHNEKISGDVEPNGENKLTVYF